MTTVRQTLVDIAADLPLDALARACHEAGFRYGTTPAQVDAVMRRGDTGARKLRSIMRGEHARSRRASWSARFVELLEQHDLPLPQTNGRAGTKRVDCRWREQQLTVELDSYRFHN